MSQLSIIIFEKLENSVIPHTFLSLRCELLSQKGTLVSECGICHFTKWQIPHSDTKVSINKRKISEIKAQ